MKRVFADTHFYIALLNRDDPAHAQAIASLESGAVETIVTTGWVIVETANAMAKSRRRSDCGRFLRELGKDKQTMVVPASEELQRRGLDLYIQRQDKGWSLTDCISFVVMADEKLTEALTADHHFEQAGFTTLLAS